MALFANLIHIRQVFSLSWRVAAVVRWMTLAALVLAPTTVTAQGGTTLGARYESAVTALQQRRDAVPALQLAQEWTRKQFETAVARPLASQDLERAAALLHLEIASRETDADNALFHVRLGERVLAPLAKDEGTPADFVARWSAVASSVFLARTDVVRARAALSIGRDRRSHDAHVRMAAGAIDDLASLAFDAEGRRPVLLDRSAALAVSRRATLLARAEGEYRAAVNVAPDLGPARIRLGRILARRGKLEEARAEFEVARTRALSTGERYLLLLFLAAVYEEVGDSGLARASLTEAVDIAGDRQGSWMALAQLEERDGHARRARGLVAAGLARTRADSIDEWWEYRNGGFDRAGFAWLRAAVWR